MNYDLAKELKDAGFPLRATQVSASKERMDTNIVLHSFRVDDYWYAFPTLEELIEACGDDFDSMYRGSDGSWLAESPMFNDGDALGNQVKKGESNNSPAEAVARLWLALNKKG